LIEEKRLRVKINGKTLSQEELNLPTYILFREDKRLMEIKKECEKIELKMFTKACKRAIKKVLGREKNE